MERTGHCRRQKRSFQDEHELFPPPATSHPLGYCTVCYLPSVPSESTPHTAPGGVAEGKNDEEVAAKLSEAATAAAAWAARNGVAFDQGKTEAALFHKKRTASKATVVVGDSKVPFNKEATR